MSILVAAIQMHSVPNQPMKNLNTALKMVRNARSQGAGIIVLPELWKSGYYLSKEEFGFLGENKKGSTVRKFQELAMELGVVLVVPFIEKEEKNLYISTAVIEKSGDLLACYRKSFLWGREKETFSPGEREYEAVQTSVGNIGILICYDIEFPEPSRHLALQGVELIIAPSVWSIPAEPRWDIQLPARALDNTVFVLGVNTAYEGSCGKSKLIAPDGRVLAEAPANEPCILIHEVNFDLIRETRKKIPYLRDLNNGQPI
ncbi:carbon-nitrogen hydrolase [Siminovitchia terrae]|uniref:Carbon-nitrogen hydrolase n=1 Tax=Siminovitchia terrae TaxID=1914933 RepID=A0ABQ4KU90_SIMTE|nr:nitrilase-related carbon-nitrogen hydrolase [Siminovitchia terrae]GIN93542.1 carbon-nitrogen hydrolase [Siminovitchia terrae]GIN95612.1 carbon-nitrogen hydrolase [Siminovitchia terrae]